MWHLTLPEVAQAEDRNGVSEVGELIHEPSLCISGLLPGPASPGHVVISLSGRLPPAPLDEGCCRPPHRSGATSSQRRTRGEVSRGRLLAAALSLPDSATSQPAVTLWGSQLPF